MTRWLSKDAEMVNKTGLCLRVYPFNVTGYKSVLLELLLLPRQFEDLCLEDILAGETYISMPQLKEKYSWKNLSSFMSQTTNSARPSRGEKSVSKKTGVIPLKSFLRFALIQ